MKNQIHLKNESMYNFIVKKNEISIIPNFIKIYLFFLMNSQFFKKFLLKKNNLI